jgi:hypothetical protein
MKRNFNRFMRMVESKKQAVQAVVKEQERLFKEQKLNNPALLLDRDVIEPEVGFDLLKKKKPSYKHTRRY